MRGENDVGRCGLGWGNNHIQMRLHTPLLSTTILIPNIFLFHLYLYTAYYNILSIYLYYNAAESDAYEFREDFMNIVWDSNQAKKNKKNTRMFTSKDLDSATKKCVVVSKSPIS